MPLSRGELGRHSGHLTQCGGAEVYLRTKWHLDPSSRLASIDMGRKVGGCCASFYGELNSRLTQCGLGRGLLPYHVASSSTQPFGHNRHLDPSSPSAATDMGQKLGAVPLWKGAGSPSNTMLSPKLPIFCRVGSKTLIQTQSQLPPS